MELRQLRYFVRVVERGSMGRAAVDLDIVTSALSQQIAKLERELSIRLLHRTSTGVAPTDAGVAFWRQAQLALRNIDAAVQGAQQARLAGHVSVGLAPSTAGILGLPFMQAMRARYPDIRLHMVEALSGNLATMLTARQLDLAVLFRVEPAHRGPAIHLLDESLFLMAAAALPGVPRKGPVRLAHLARLPLIMPSGSHGLRALLDQAFARTRHEPMIVAEIDGLAMLMDAVRGGLGATIQPGAALSRHATEAPTAPHEDGTPNALHKDGALRALHKDGALRALRVTDAHARRPNLLCSLPEAELSPAGLAARVVLGEVARALVREGRWRGARLPAADGVSAEARAAPAAHSPGHLAGTPRIHKS
ncbi:LysR family transcriptional regulator [Robbsia sp. Bb-Pol-6]|uniref:LysR family transcriptional regulator n=1 Tax=Robbsia betulipollinis TaxID=2981849 RepID=A0ABT3ZS22_9BURK|nr:LysR family transcriptional regulator [Robbsia betulipollinis]MCY0389277.1 LysR family transcriptional regulator [Robbsia betulipollinis]